MGSGMSMDKPPIRLSCGAYGLDQPMHVIAHEDVGMQEDAIAAAIALRILRRLIPERRRPTGRKLAPAPDGVPWPSTPVA
jgi:hypothetical protein